MSATGLLEVPDHLVEQLGMVDGARPQLVVLGAEPSATPAARPSSLRLASSAKPIENVSTGPRCSAIRAVMRLESRPPESIRRAARRDHASRTDERSSSSSCSWSLLPARSGRAARRRTASSSAVVDERRPRQTSVVAGRQLAHAGEQVSRGRGRSRRRGTARPPAGRARGDSPAAMSDLTSDANTRPGVGVVERLDAHPVAREHQRRRGPSQSAIANMPRRRSTKSSAVSS